MGIKNPHAIKKIQEFQKYKKGYENRLRALRDTYKGKSRFEKQRVELDKSMISEEKFSNILSDIDIEIIQTDLTNEMLVSENTLYALGQNIFRRLGNPKPKVQFWYNGRCTHCGCDTETKIDVERPIKDFMLNDPWLFNEIFSEIHDYIKCQSCNETTEPVKTRNLFQLEGKNEYNVQSLVLRTKSQGRMIPKIVEICSGKQKDLRDVYGIMFVCESEKDCKRVPELVIRYHSDSGMECKNYFEDVKVQSESGIKLMNPRYFVYFKNNGLVRGRTVELLERKVRKGKKGRQAVYRAIHSQLRYIDTPIEVQSKTLAQFMAENDPKSPLYHGAYVATERGDSCAPIYSQEREEKRMREGWGPFEEALERLLRSKNMFSRYNPYLYES